MVDQKDGLARLTVKVHMDEMKRVTVREQEYFYYNISNTPFTLGIVMPSKYGKYRVSGGLELNQNRHIDGKLFTTLRKILKYLIQQTRSFRTIDGSCTLTGCTASTIMPELMIENLTAQKKI